MLKWLKKYGPKLALLLVRAFIKDKTVVGRIAKAIEEAEEEK